MVSPRNKWRRFVRRGGVAKRAFDPEQPIARPVRTVLPLPRTVRADELLRAGQALDSLLVGEGELFVDFETLGPVGDPRADVLTQLVERLRGRGLRVHGSFTLGHDHDDVGCFERLVEWVEARRLAKVEVRLWTPDPGSSAVRVLAIADRVVHRDLERWDGAHVVVNPARMSAQTLYRGWAWTRRELGSLRSVWRRRPSELVALPPYLLSMVHFVRGHARARGSRDAGASVVIRPSGPATLQA
jgi:hypothetical protein